MKAISIWQPFASLIVEGCKVFETRGWPAPASAIGTRIGIAATKTVLPAQRSHCEDEAFQAFYARTGLDDWQDLPRGVMLGTVEIDSVELMTEEMMEDVSAEEKSYGWWEPGNYAWRLTRPVKFTEPIPIKGMQGLFEWKGHLPRGHKEPETTRHKALSRLSKESQGVRSGRPADAQGVWRHLRIGEQE